MQTDTKMKFISFLSADFLISSPSLTTLLYIVYIWNLLDSQWPAQFFASPCSYICNRIKLLNATVEQPKQEWI